MPLGVAMISSVFYPSIGGAQRVVLDVSRGLRARGVEVVVVTRHYRGLARYEEINGVPIYRVGWGDRSKAVAALSYIVGALWLLLRLRRRFQVLHCHQMISPMTIGLLAKLLLRRPLVVMPHGGGEWGDISVLTKRRPVTGKLRLAIARRWVDAFLCISGPIHAELRSVGVPEARIWDIANGVDVTRIVPVSAERRRELRTQLGLPAGPLVIYTGRLAVEKGLQVLLEAWPALLEQLPAARLLLVGTGEQGDALRERAEQLGIAHEVVFYGRSEDVTPLLQAADAFVLPSFSEGLPISLLEAMACGLPCVGTAVVGTQQLLQDKHNGRVVPAGDAGALSEALTAALVAPAARVWGARARQHVVEQYGLDYVLGQYLRLYAALSPQLTADVRAVAAESVRRESR